MKLPNAALFVDSELLLFKISAAGTRKSSIDNAFGAVTFILLSCSIFIGFDKVEYNDSEVGNL